MAKPIVFWFDFASPYAYFAQDAVARLAARHGRTVAWRPFLLWAVIKAHGIAPPQEAAARWSYLLHDMKRSADFMGLPFKAPKLPVSAHLSMRLFYAVCADRPDLARPLMSTIFRAFMVDGMAITDPDVLAGLVAPLGIDSSAAQAAMTGADGRAMLAAAVEEATAAGVIGSPYTIIDGEPFFGADRLAQMEWFLSKQSEP